MNALSVHQLALEGHPGGALERLVLPYSHQVLAIEQRLDLQQLSN